jgi:hypothetical protein
MTTLNCEAIARAGLGEPVKREGAELLYHCPRADRHKNGDVHASLKVNTQKNKWGCFVCDKKGSPWKLAAFLSQNEASDKAAITAWLKAKGLLGNKHRHKPSDGRGPCVATYLATLFFGGVYAQIRSTFPSIERVCVSNPQCCGSCLTVSECDEAPKNAKKRIQNLGPACWLP